MKKPVIGITLDLAQDSEKYSYSSLPWYALRRNYADSVNMAGGFALMLPYNVDDINTTLDLIDGLILPGGDEDINPKFYGQEIISEHVKINDTRATFEMALVKRAIERQIPILGICLGLQVINTVFGGTLLQHIPDVVKSEINHQPSTSKHLLAHSILIENGTIIEELAGTSKLMVNSNHHQAIDKVGKGLIASAKAEDGVIEAIESTEHRFLVGIQWHAEYLNSDLDSNLFKRLVEECSQKE